MVTKRRTSTEQERSVSYENEKSYIDIPMTEVPQDTQNDFEYSKPTRPNTVANKKVTQTVVTRDPEIYMPTYETMLHKANENNKNSREKMEVKTKVMLAVYMLAVIILSAIVIATGIAVSDASSRVDSLQNEYSVKAEQLTDQANRIDQLSDPDYITGRAYGNGMEGIESVGEVTLVEIHEPVSYEQRTNWFDSFCKWVSSIIGG